MVIRSISPEATSPELTKYSVRSVQPRTLQPPSLQPCLHIKTRLTVTLLQTLLRFKWNGFEISSSKDKYQIRQKINGEESKLQERQVDVTAKFSTSLKSSINRDEDLENHIEQEYTRKRPILCAKRRKQNINNLENSFNCSYLRILKCLEKQSLFCFVLYIKYSKPYSILCNC